MVIRQSFERGTNKKIFLKGIAKRDMLCYNIVEEFDMGIIAA